MGADSSSVSDWNVRQTNLQKVFKRGKFLLGYAYSFRMGQLLQYSLEVEPAAYGPDLEYLSTVFVAAVRKCLGDGGIKRDAEGDYPGLFLLAYRGELYQVGRDLQVNHYGDDYTAIGSGAEYALGSLYSTPKLEPSTRIIQALMAAAHFNGSVCEPFFVMSEKDG
jgi:ATP-dependent protease HslVU (ClpYQ) peptidase subunit